MSIFLAILFQFALGDEAFVLQHTVESFSTVAFAEHETVAVGPVRILRVYV